MKYVPCTHDEKQTITSMIQGLVRLSEQTKHDGILSLEKGITAYPDSFRRVLFGMLFDAVDPATIESYGRIRIASSGFTGMKLLEAMAVLEATISISKDENPDVLGTRLSAFFGMNESELRYRLNLLPSAGKEEKPATKALFEQPATSSGIKKSYHEHLQLSRGQLEYLESLAPRAGADLLSAVYNLKEEPLLELGEFQLSDWHVFDDSISITTEQSAATILNAINSAAARRILEVLIERDAGLAELVARNMLSFDDLILFDAEMFRTILANVSPSIFIRAIKGTDAQAWQRMQKLLQPRTIQILDFFRQNLAVSDEAVAQAQAMVLREMRNHPATSLILGALDKISKKENNHDQS